MVALRTLTLVLASSLALAQETPTYRAQTDLVQVSFHVGRDKYYVSDLKQSDIVLLEDGKARPFATFEGPATEHRTMELVLLFDTFPISRPSGPYNPKLLYAFAEDWDEVRSRSLLETGKANVRASVYRIAGPMWSNVCHSTADPRELVSAFRSLLAPLRGEGVWLAEMHPGIGMGWSLEAALRTLSDATAVPDHVSRALILFSAGQGNRVPPRAGDKDAAVVVRLGIPIYSVILDPNLPDDERNLPRSVGGQVSLRSLAELTGGISFDVKSIDANKLRDILESVKNEGLSQFVAGFVPAPSSAPLREHKLEIRLVSKSGGKIIGGKRTAVY